MLKGIPVSPGIAVARAYCVDEALARREPQGVDEANIAVELGRLDHAVHASSQELETIIKRVSLQVGEEEAAIFRGHRQILRDPTLLTKIKNAIIDQRVNAPTALHVVLDEYTELFSRIADDYLKDRLADIRDVISRIMSHLAEEEAERRVHILGEEPLIVVAPEILPSQALVLKKFQVAGIITEAGGSTGHAAILSRSLGIPSVAGLGGILSQVTTGDLLALDGREGHVYVKPDGEVEAFYRKLQREYVDLYDRLIENRDLDAVSKDGAQVDLLANVNGPPDAAMAARTGAAGIGLYRTEYLFLTHPSVPSEEEQLATYRAVLEAAPPGPVTIRTLDLGGDKLVPYFSKERETNPFMGFRSIRLNSHYPEFFQTQLRAILRAGLYGQVKLLFPMVSTLEEVRQLKRLLAKTKTKLRRDGLKFGDDLPLGIMLEVPAAALCLEAILEEVDFVCIGSNDLTQYVMAADRDNPKVAHLCDPFSPPVLKLLRYIVRTCDRFGKPVTLCGEMAGRPRCFLALFGMGLRRLSMSPAFIPTIKEMVRTSSFENARRVAGRALKLRTFQQVRNYLTRKTRELCPNLVTLDMFK